MIEAESAGNTPGHPLLSKLNSPCSELFTRFSTKIRHILAFFIRASFRAKVSFRMKKKNYSIKRVVESFLN
jgi:hypothetical protein